MVFIHLPPNLKFPWRSVLTLRHGAWIFTCTFEALSILRLVSSPILCGWPDLFHKVQVQRLIIIINYHHNIIMAFNIIIIIAMSSYMGTCPMSGLCEWSCWLQRGSGPLSRWEFHREFQASSCRHFHPRPSPRIWGIPNLNLEKNTQGLGQPANYQIPPRIPNGLLTPTFLSPTNQQIWGIPICKC